MKTRVGERPATARATAIRLAGEIAGDPATVYLDTETTGTDGRAEVIEVAVVDGDGGTLLDLLVRPNCRIPVPATAIHGITDDDVRRAAVWSAIYPALDQILRGRRVVVYNAAFDRRLIGQSCARAGLAAPAWRWECAMRLYARYRAEPGRNGDFRWHSLERAATACHVPAGNHRARADALCCRELVIALAAGR